MNFQLKHPHVDLPEDLQEKIQEKMARFERVLPEPAYIELCFEQLPKVMQDGDTGGDKQVEVRVDIPHTKPVIRFSCYGMTFMEAVDRVLDKLDVELSHRKEKEEDHGHGPNDTPPKEVAAEMETSEVS